LSRPRLAFLGAGFAALVAVFVWSIWLALHRPPGFESLQATDMIWALPFIAFPAVGIIILARRPGNRVGWVLFGIGIAIGVGLAATEVGRLLSVSHGAGGTLVFLAGDGGIKMGLALVAILLLVFPGGRLPGPRWRWVLRLLLGVAALTVAASFLASGRLDQGNLPASPLAWTVGGPIVNLIDGRPGLAVYSLLLLCCAAAPFIRYRGSNEQVRRQLKWVAWSSGIFACAEVVTNSIGLAPGLPDPVRAALLVPPAVAGAAVAASIGIAVLRHRLYDIDAVISRTLAYAALAALIVAAYLAVVVGAGALVGSRSGSNVLLPILTTALVAIAFQPVRRRLERLADRIVYGTRATPYELLSRFAQRAAAEYPDERALERLAHALADGLGAHAVTVVLAGHAEGPHHAAAAWPPDSTPSASSVLASAPVVDAGEVIGELKLWRATPLSQTEQRLLDDLAAQASLLIRNVRVTAELRLRLDELRASRQRLVAAQDDERRRIERNLHDGAQQQLIAIAGRLGLAEGRPLDPQTARLFAELKVEVASALDDLRGIGRGLYPPLLASQGLRPALAALARRAPLPVSLDVSAERFDRTLEGAVYFCVSEALQNACRHSGATSVDVGVVSGGDRVSFSVRDNGSGIGKQDVAAPGASSGGGLQNMADRMAAVGGGLNVASSDSGTEVAGWCPERISASIKSADDERT
jgi:signal transduction histidine kinase